MKIELSRHDWKNLRSFAGSAVGLGDTVRILVEAKSREEAESAYAHIDGVALLNRRLSQSAPAVASCLVQGLFSASPAARTIILEILAEIAGSFDHDAMDLSAGPVTYEACMDEVILGLPVYCEIVESGAEINDRVICIDLILMCGLHDTRVKNRVSHTLVSVRDMEDFAAHVGLIDNSLAELHG